MTHVMYCEKLGFGYQYGYERPGLIPFTIGVGASTPYCYGYADGQGHLYGYAQGTSGNWTNNGLGSPMLTFEQIKERPSK